MVVKQFKSGSGNSSSSWLTVKNVTSTEPFLVEDSTGSVKVIPNNATTYLNLKKSYSSSINSSFNLNSFNLNKFKLSKDYIDNLESAYLKNIKERPVVNGKIKCKLRFYKDGDREYSEYFLKPGDNCYVLGTVSNKDNSSELYIHKEQNQKYFVIGDKENTILKKIKGTLIYTFILSVLSFGLLVYFIVSML